MTHPIITKMRELAAERPDFVYEMPEVPAGEDVQSSAPADTCLYYDPYADAPSCIVGQALFALGYETSADDEGDAGSEVVARVMHDQEGLSSEEGDWIDSVQGSQDNGERWIDAIAQADGEDIDTIDEEG